MSRIVAVGERRRLEGFALAGVKLLRADTRAEAQAAWSRLDPDVAVVILTPATWTALSDLLVTRPEVIWTMLPD